ncbi:unnamed protein product [Agarophyton chilense]
MSTSSGAKSRAPAHQNSFAFRHNKRSKLTDKIQRTVDTQALCNACANKIEWRKKYRKYKPLTVPSRCNRCRAKRVFSAYHTLCSSCTAHATVCAMCATAMPRAARNVAAVDMRDARVAALVESLSERERRTVLRLVEKGTCVSDALSKIGLTLLEQPTAPSEQQTNDGDVHDSGLVHPHHLHPPDRSRCAPIAAVRDQQ